MQEIIEAAKQIVELKEMETEYRTGLVVALNELIAQITPEGFVKAVANLEFACKMYRLEMEQQNGKELNHYQVQ